MGRSCLRSVAGIFAVLACGLGVRAQTPAAQLHVATANGATTFHIGERIPLQMDFTAAPEAHLGVRTMSTRNFMMRDSFEVSPSSGFSDPLAAYFEGGAFSGMIGMAELSQKPSTIRVDLNEWGRFDSPGDYTVIVHSDRVFSVDRSALRTQEQVVTSNAIRLHIIAATPEWQKATLARAVQAMAVKRQPLMPASEEVAGAIAEVRFLGTADAVKVMADGLGDDQLDRASAFALGLIGLPPALNELGRREVRERIEDPEVAVSSFHLTAFAGLEMDPADSPEENFRRRGAAYAEAERLAIAALPRKRGKAKAATADFLLRSGPGGFTAEERSEIARAIAPVFSEVPEDKQAILLGWHWDVLRSVITAQTLEQIVSLPVSDPSSRVMPNYERMQLKSVALSRLYEMDPEAAKRIAFAQIGSATPTFTAQRLWFLPAEPLPQYEPVWAQALLSDSEGSKAEVLAPLMVRFGTGEFAAQVAAKVRESLSEGEACEPEYEMLAYVVKFNAEVAGPLLRDALAARDKTRCYSGMFRGVARYATGPALTDAALEAIADPDAQTAIDAVSYLAVYGDGRARKPMLERYTAWAQEWAGRADELEAGQPFKPSPNGEQEQFGEALGRALLVNQGWVTDDGLRAEVVKRCVGAQMCRAVNQEQMMERPPYQVTLFANEGSENIRLGAHEIPSLELLKAKLAQYPRGTAFAMMPPTGSGDVQRFQQRVRAAFDDAGMTLGKTP